MSFNEWHRVSIKDVFELIPGFAFKSKDFSENGIPVIKIKNVKALRLLDRDFSYIDPKYLETKSRFTTKKGDLLISMTGNRIEGSMSSWVGKVCRINSDKKYLINQRVGILRLSNESYSDKFFLYLLGSEEIQKKLISIATSSGGQANISPDQIKSLEFSIPCFEEQNAIAHILSTLDDKIEVNSQINRTLENMAQTIFKQWFVDFEFPNEDGEPYKSSGGEMVESELGMIPKGWEVKKLVDVLETLEAGNRPKGGAGNLTEGIPSIGAENIIGLGKYDYSKEKYVTEEYFAKMNKGKVNPGDVLLYKDGAQLGRKTMFMNGFPHKKCCINSHVFILRTNDMLTQSYLYFWLDQDWVTQSIINLNANSAQPGINQSKLKTLKILTPKFNYVEMFDVIIKSLLNKLFENCIENNALHKTRDALLPKLMSGEIRVSLDVEDDAS
jgi:type I restriction enzyme S subunit